MIKLSAPGSFNKTMLYFKNGKDINNKIRAILDRYGKKGVAELAANTPFESGETSNAWYYVIKPYGLYFCNSNINNGVPIAIILQYGHATGTGGYVQGIDYINPVLQPIFNEISSEIDKEVRNL